MKIETKQNIYAELYDIINYCRDDTLENFKSDLLEFLAQEVDDEKL